MRRFRTLPGIVAGLGVVVALVGLDSSGAGAAPAQARTIKHTVVVSGLNNPRQLSLVGNDELLIAEAGHGGSTKVTGPEGATFVGPSGSISAVLLPQFARNTQPVRIVRGLMSGAGPDGSFAVGSDGVSSLQAHGPIYIQETYAPKDALPAPFGSKQDGRLLRARPYSYLAIVANITKFERRHDPDRKGFDSDPYAVLARPGRVELVADAAGNDVLTVGPQGHLRVFHVFPNIIAGPCAKQADPPGHRGCNFVPTALAVDGKGHVYVGGLGSEVPGQGRVVELSANGKKVLHTWKGFTSVSGVAVGRDGSVYVSQLEAPESAPPAAQVAGVLTRINPRGHRTNVDVPFPAGVAVNSRGTVFVSAWSVAPAGGLAGPGTSGQVWRLHF
jgi:hypothetical protein